MHFIFKDRHGKTWITAEGLRRYFGIRVSDLKRYFYRYDVFKRRGSYGLQ